ncbi:hypothetical protein GCM10008967_14030 [Bacillus carboniphilus]|uniref:Molybdopterin synthase sulfur carrier subunit n=1 Tax=Bacillus carboniphilus TaxID=86663 RepID=A0ABP3FTL8_9BACI
MVELLFFANLKEKLGTGTIQWMETPITVSELKKQLETQYSLTNLDSVMIAINAEFAENHEIIKSGDQVAFIEPVSGG